ncbi:EF-hand calcium-binding domain-containing protein 11 [Buteo buteo]|uniref:EF-hand calcium-binding domain-containing protein 11 n=1 Tax=Buteo buteo TaxID=30397 RepID=UPI003EBA11A8
MDYIKACSVYQNELSRRLVLITLIYYKLVTAVSIFEARDEDNKGYLRREDFKVAVVMSFGYKPSKVEVDSVMSSVRPYRGFLTFEDFQRAFNSVSPKLSEKTNLFSLTEVDQDSDGRISFKEFESAMKYGQDEVSPVYFA